MDIANLVLPVFAVIITGWLAGASGYMPRTLAGPLVQFAYYVAMPALVFLTIAEQSLADLLDWRFLLAFGGGSMLCFLAVALACRLRPAGNWAESGMYGTAAAMTNTGFVALPILQALYGARGVLPAAIATAFIAVAMFPALILLLELGGRGRGGRASAGVLVRQVVANPVMLSTLGGLAWAVAGLPLPASVAAYTGIFGAALTPCALFSIGLGLSFDGVRRGLGISLVLTAIKLVVTPLVTLLLCRTIGLDTFYTVAAVVCAAVPTAKTAYVVAGEYHVAETVVAATISLTTLLSVASLLGWLYLLS